jgi:cytochrome c oxidase assembly factor CtaG
MTAALLHGNVSWGAWSLEPTVLGGALVVLGIYLLGLSREQSVAPLRPVLFLTGASAMLLALVSPLDAAAHHLLSFHMLQHVFLTTIGPPLVLLGLPAALLLPLFRGRSGRAAALLTTPVVAGTLFIVNMWLWHVPPVYEAALTHTPVHALMHVAFMATGLLFWWPVVQPLPQVSRTSDGTRLLYLLATGFPMGLLALLLLASNTVLYSFYETQTHRLWGISPLEDQQVAGVVMGALGEAAAFVAITLLFFRFLEREEADSSAGQGWPGAA